MNLLGLEIPDARWHERDKMLAALDRWIRQRPRLTPSDYGDAKTYRAEIRSISRDLRDARTMLRYVARSQMPPETLRKAFSAYYSGRLQWNGERLDYTTGQYWPVEYRRAACAVLAGALWNYWQAGKSTQSTARNAFGLGIAKRWFS